MSFSLKNLWKRKPKYRRVGLVLSGGGLRGIGHIGAIQALEEHGYKPDIISGCSAGAIIGAFYAAGYSPAEMLEILQKTSLFPATSLRLRTSGLIDPKFLKELFKHYLPEDTFESLATPLYVATTNLSTGKTVYFKRGVLHDVLLASSSVPLVFPGVHHEQQIYYDGGVLNNLPVEPLRNTCDFLIGVHVNALDVLKEEKMAPLKVLDRVVHLAIGRSVAENAKYCQLFIEPPEMLKFGMFTKKDIPEIHRYVYEYTTTYLQKIAMQ